MGIMQTRRNTFISVVLMIGLIFFTESVASEMDCAGILHWSETDPPVNQQHVFCGEWNKRKTAPQAFTRDRQAQTRLPSAH